MVTAAEARRRAKAGAARPFVRIAAWWSGLEAAERVLYRAVVLLGAGFGLIYPPLALVVPGLLFAATFFGFRFGGRS